jgi:hypothetical protein
VGLVLFDLALQQRFCSALSQRASATLLSR